MRKQWSPWDSDTQRGGKLNSGGEFGCYRCQIVVLNLRSPFPSSTWISHLGMLHSQQGALGPFVSASAVFDLNPGAPCYLKLKRKTVLLIIWNRHIPLSDTILYSSQLSCWALSSGITWIIFSTAFAGWLNYATCHMFPLSTACGLMGPGGLAHIYAATQVRVPGMW